MTLPLTNDPDLQSPARLRAVVMIYSQAKVQGQRSVGSEDRVETNGQADGLTGGWREAIALPPMLMPLATINDIGSWLWSSAPATVLPPRPSYFVHVTSLFNQSTFHLLTHILKTFLNYVTLAPSNRINAIPISLKYTTNPVSYCCWIMMHENVQD